MHYRAHCLHPSSLLSVTITTIPLLFYLVALPTCAVSYMLQMNFCFLLVVIPQKCTIFTNNDAAQQQHSPVMTYASPHVAHMCMAAAPYCTAHTTDGAMQLSQDWASKNIVDDCLLAFTWLKGLNCQLADSCFACCSKALASAGLVHTTTACVSVTGLQAQTSMYFDLHGH